MNATGIVADGEKRAFRQAEFNLRSPVVRDSGAAATVGWSASCYTMPFTPFARSPMTLRSASQAGTPSAARLAQVLQQLARIVVGKEDPLRLSLACLLARGHLLI